MENNKLPKPTNISVSKEAKAIKENIDQRKQSAMQKFPLLFTLLGAFGLVTTFYGFEHLIDRIPLLANNPIVMLIVGVTILVSTGTLYRKLG